ncbi:DNA-3-methyladenine glycosylase I [Piscirickettsia litoralis]|uniref:DNA-3-methyladenine glycosylase n=1 Tax=Piscirickettsia litoralis TaxID=1891921 RepID=A0ABX3A4R6_9GAMM|nr:DNA-3-methyladenine glycosylase I [Piscirickettsia litoralis]ODN42638.1 DNA-3-methyladenine glycosylase [Piscirickettsia litoralis]
MKKTRCNWVPEDNALYQDYHDRVWGVPVYDERTLFEFLLLEGAQAGLSWITVLKKREHYHRVYAGFDPVKIARFSDKKIEKLLQDPGIIRNRLKVMSAVKNAQALLAMKEQGVDFSDYIWDFVDGSPIQNDWKNVKQVPAKTAVSDKMAKELKRLGFSFVGSTICYAFMQATGMVNDHTVDCFRHQQCQG